MRLRRSFASLAIVLAACSAGGAHRRDRGGEGRVAVHRATPTYGTDDAVGRAWAASDGSWVVVCQQRRQASPVPGERPPWTSPYLVVGDGPELALDDFLAADDTERLLAWVRGNELVIRDLARVTEVVVDRVTRRARWGDADARLASFDPSGRYFAYVRQSEGRDAIVVFDREGRSRRALDVAIGSVTRLEFEPTGHWLTAWIRERGPAERLDAIDVAPTCREPDRGTVPRGESRRVRFVNLERWRFEGDTSALQPIGEALLVRRSDGAIVTVAGDGASTELVTARCSGRVYCVDPMGGYVIATCVDGAPSGIPALKQFSPARSAIVATRTMITTDSFRWCPPLVALDTLDDPDIYDVGRARHLHAAPGLMAGVLGDRFAVLPDDTYSMRLYDARSGAERTLATRIAADALDEVRGEFAWSPQIVTDLRTGETRYGGERLIHAVTTDGRVLVGRGPSDSPRGPLTWVRFDSLDPVP